MPTDANGVFTVTDGDATGVYTPGLNGNATLFSNHLTNHPSGTGLTNGYLDIPEQNMTALASPTVAGTRRLAVDSADHALKVKTTTGTLITLEDLPWQQQYLVKTAPQSFSTTGPPSTMTNDNHLFFTTQTAVERWDIFCQLYYQPFSSTLFQVAFTYSGTGVGLFGNQGSWSGTSDSPLQPFATAMPVTAVSMTTGSTYGLLVRGKFTTTTAGTFRLQWGHKVAVAGQNTTVLQDSKMVAQKVG